MPKLDFILFADSVEKTPEGYWNVQGVMTSLQRLAPQSGVQHEIRKLDGFFRVSGCEPSSVVPLRIVAYLSDGITRLTDPADPYNEAPTTAAGVAFGSLKLRRVPYDLGGLYFAIEHDGQEIGREFLPVSPLY